MSETSANGYKPMSPGDRDLQMLEQSTAIAVGPPTAAPIVSHRENYAQGFEGMATAAFPEAARAVLSEKINPEDVEIKPDGIVYLPGAFYRNRLMRAFGAGGWALAPRSPARRLPGKNASEIVTYHGALIALGRFVAEAIGQCAYYPNNAGMQYPDAFEGAKTDCITRCCKDLGVAWELWDPGWRTQWQSKYAHKGNDGKWCRNGRVNKLDVGQPNATPPTAAPSVPTAVNAPAVAPGPSRTAAPASTPKAENDNEPYPTDAELDELDDLVLGRLRWTKDLAGMWLFTHFGIRDPSKITLAQFKTVCKLLMVVDTPKYDATLAECVAAGLCRPKAQT